MRPAVSASTRGLTAVITPWNVPGFRQNMLAGTTRLTPQVYYPALAAAVALMTRPSRLSTSVVSEHKGVLVRLTQFGRLSGYGFFVLLMAPRRMPTVLSPVDLWRKACALPQVRGGWATSACRMYISGHLRTPSPSYRASRTRSTRLLLRSTTLAGRLRKPSPSLVVASTLATNARGLASGTWVWRLRSPPSMGLLRGRSRRLSLRVVYRHHFHPEWSPQHCRPACVGRRGRCGCGGGGPATPWSKDRGGGLRGVTHPDGFG